MAASAEALLRPVLEVLPQEPTPNDFNPPIIARRKIDPFPRFYYIEEPKPIRQIDLKIIDIPVARTGDELSTWASIPAYSRASVVYAIAGIAAVRPVPQKNHERVKVNYKLLRRRGLSRAARGVLEAVYPDGNLKLPNEIIEGMTVNVDEVIEQLEYEQRMLDSIVGHEPGSLIRRYREMYGLSDAGLAAKIDADHKQLRMIELDSAPSLYLLGRVFKVFGWKVGGCQSDLYLTNALLHTKNKFNLQELECPISMDDISEEEISLMRDEMSLGGVLKLLSVKGGLERGDLTRRTGISSHRLSDIHSGLLTIGVQAFARLLIGYGLTEDDWLSQLLFQKALEQPPKPLGL